MTGTSSRSTHRRRAAAWRAVLLAGLAAALLIRAALRRARRPRAEVISLENSNAEDPDTGAVRSVQEADLLIDADALAEIWTPASLERLARTYWRFLTRVTLGVIRVHYSDHARSVVLLSEPLRLLTFQAPEYELDARRGLVRWRIERGLLVSARGRHGRGHLQIEVRREQAAQAPGRELLHVAVEVANFYPAIAFGISRRFYNATQSRIHVFVTYGFLRSLARLNLAESRVGRLRDQ